MRVDSADLLVPGTNGAFVREGYGTAPAITATSSALTGLRLAVKDVFDVQGLRMGAGNPVWLAQQAPAAKTALALRWLLEASASWVGKTVTDELAYSLAGINVHYGTPVNPAVPRRIPGGSSSGSAVAVAAHLADIGLGSDCGGSCRLPASYCGIWGFRPTQGRIAKNGAFSLAHSFDTAGWFARDGATMAKVYAALTHTQVPAPAQAALVVSSDVLAVCDPAVQVAFAELVNALPTMTELPAGSLPLSDWAQAHRTLQAAEIWQQHGSWVAVHGDSLGADVRQRFVAASRLTRDDVTAAQPVRTAATQRLGQLFADTQALLLLPTVPTIAPLLDTPQDVVDATRARSQQLLCIAGLAGLPQLSLPWTTVDGAPIGLSLIGPHGADAQVLSAAQWLQQVL